jgi:hypothetical protein
VVGDGGGGAAARNDVESAMRTTVRANGTFTNDPFQRPIVGAAPGMKSAFYQLAHHFRHIAPYAVSKSET